MTMATTTTNNKETTTNSNDIDDKNNVAGNTSLATGVSRIAIIVACVVFVATTLTVKNKQLSHTVIHEMDIKNKKQTESQQLGYRNYNHVDIKDNSTTKTTSILYNIKHEQQQQQNDQRHNDNDTILWPKIVWLMSFPNSGTSYTSKLVRHLSQTRTATNYGQENLGEDGTSIPVYKDDPNGPFWVDPKVNAKLHDPEHFVLTKTHCGGYCTQCALDEKIETTHSFKHHCFSTQYKTKENADKKDQYEKGVVDHNHLAKVIHVIRNPFDNIVSRFNMNYKLHRANLKESDSKSPSTFRNYCNQIHNTFGTQLLRGTRAVDYNLVRSIQHIPCYADFIRYVEWHNMAFITTNDLKVETMLLHYSDYTTNFNATATNILNFLELEPIGTVPPFEGGKVYYDEYFTKQERNDMKKALEKIASRITWEHINKYFGE